MRLTHIGLLCAGLITLMSTVGCSDSAMRKVTSTRINGDISSSALAEMKQKDDFSLMFVYEALGPCDDPCIIKSNMGGNTDLYWAAAKSILAGSKKLVEIGVDCISACAQLADVARERVCIRPGAVFRFHAATMIDYDGSDQAGKGGAVIGAIPKHSKDIHDWVMSHGGFVKTDVIKDMTAMTFDQARAFWRVCPEVQEVAAAPAEKHP